MLRARYIPALLLALLATRAHADAVLMRDGSIRFGTMIARTTTSIQFRMERDGMTTVVVIPISQINTIVLGAQPPAPAITALNPNPTAATTTPATNPTTTTSPSPIRTAATAPANNQIASTNNTTRPIPTPPATSTTSSSPSTPTTSITSASDAELAAFASRGFLRELMAASLGKGLDDPDRLPAADRALWDAALTADKAGKNAEALESLRTLESAMRDLPDGLARLDAIAHRQRQESAGTWMARAHWEVIRTKFSTGQFDLNDVRDLERRPLIALLRKATAPAMEPLKPFFPPVDEKTGLPGPFKPAQLAGITIASALDIKDKALFAAALILAQLKLEPDMPGVDRGVFGTQLASVNRVLARARDLEPLAKAAQIRAEQDKKAAEELARRQAAIEAQRAATRPK